VELFLAYIYSGFLRVEGRQSSGAVWALKTKDDVAEAYASHDQGIYLFMSHAFVSLPGVRRSPSIQGLVCSRLHLFYPDLGTDDGLGQCGT
jgi:hypothetical protein